MPLVRSRLPALLAWGLALACDSGATIQLAKPDSSVDDLAQDTSDSAADTGTGDTADTSDTSGGADSSGDTSPGFYWPVYGFNLDDDGGWGHTAFAGGTSNAGSDLGVDALEQVPSYDDPYKTLVMYYR